MGASFLREHPESHLLKPHLIPTFGSNRTCLGDEHRNRENSEASEPSNLKKRIPLHKLSEDAPYAPHVHARAVGRLSCAPQSRQNTPSTSHTRIISSSSAKHTGGTRAQWQLENQGDRYTNKAPNHSRDSIWRASSSTVRAELFVEVITVHQYQDRFKLSMQFCFRAIVWNGVYQCMGDVSLVYSTAHASSMDL